MDTFEFWFVVVCALVLIAGLGYLALRVGSIVLRRPSTSLEAISKGEMSLNLLSDWMASVAVRIFSLIALTFLLATIAWTIRAVLPMFGIY